MISSIFILQNSNCILLRSTFDVYNTQLIKFPSLNFVFKCLHFDKFRKHELMKIRTCQFNSSVFVRTFYFYTIIFFTIDKNNKKFKHLWRVTCQKSLQLVTTHGLKRNGCGHFVSICIFRIVNQTK